VSRVYSQSYQQTMAMPMRAFWQFSGYCDRVLTAENIDHLTLIVTGQSGGEAYTEAVERMAKVAPNPVKYSQHAVIAAGAVRDEEGFNALRGMS